MRQPDGPVAAIAMLASAAIANAGPGYTFTNIADNTGQFDELFFAPAINADGVVAFRATLDAGGQGIFRSDGGPPTTIVDSTGDFDVFSVPDISDAGLVTCAATLPSEFFHAVLTGEGGPIMTLVDSDDPDLRGGFGEPRITAAGEVAYRAGFDDTIPGAAVFVGDAMVSPIVDALGLGPEIADSGQVVYEVNLASGQRRLVTGGVGFPTETVAQTDAEIVDFIAASINQAGRLALIAKTDGGDSRLDVGDGSGFTTLIGTASSPLIELSEPHLNNNDLTAFSGRYALADEAIFAGPDLDDDRVIRSGETLFGETVEQLMLGGLNDAGQIVFAYRTQTLEGVAVASPILEPCSPADLVAPFGFLDLDDIVAFVTAFENEQPDADLAAPFGLYDLNDITTFGDLFLAGCP
jgi:hypothetical protein